MAPVAVQYLTVDEESAGQRLDNFLIRVLKGVPKTHIYRIIRSGEVRRNKGRVGADDRVVAGDVLRIPPIRLSERAEEKAANPAPAREFPVVYEDDAFMAIDKPAGVAVHGGSGVSFGVIEQMRQARPQARLLELVHRLDRETSGILLIAKKKSALKALQDQFRERETGKTYLALVKGNWPANLKVLDQPCTNTCWPMASGASKWWARTIRMACDRSPWSRWLGISQHLRVLKPHRPMGSVSWKSPSRRDARTRSGCTWPRRDIRLQAMTSTVISNSIDY